MKGVLLQKKGEGLNVPLHAEGRQFMARRPSYYGVTFRPCGHELRLLTPKNSKQNEVKCGLGF